MLAGVMDSVFAQLPLRDIHLPPPVPWWPPAWGWWLLLALVLAGVLVTAWRWRRRRRYSTRRRVRAAREELERIERQFADQDKAAALVRELSIWLRRVALTFHGRETAALTGTAWVEWWRRHGDPEAFDARLGEFLSTAPYQREVDPGQARCLLDACRASLEQVSVGSS